MFNNKHHKEVTQLQMFTNQDFECEPEYIQLMFPEIEEWIKDQDNEEEEDQKK